MHCTILIQFEIPITSNFFILSDLPACSRRGVFVAFIDE
jgi:hypothetical protein